MDALKAKVNKDRHVDIIGDFDLGKQNGKEERLILSEK